MRPMCFMTDVYNENHGTTSALYFALGSFVARLPRNPRGSRWPSSFRLCPALSACSPPFAVNPALSGTVRPCPPVVRLLSALTEHLHERDDALDLFFLRQVRGVDEHSVFGLDRLRGIARVALYEALGFFRDFLIARRAA